MSSQALQLAMRHSSPGVGRMSNLVLRSGKGCWVTTIEGEKYLDFSSGIGVVSTGHCHPKVVAATTKQVGQLVHGQVNIAFHEPMVQLLDKLRKIVPEGMDRFFFWNSGAEAVEAAVKLARHATGKQNIIVFRGGYHGRTLGTMGMTTSKLIYRDGFGPLLPGIFVAPFPYCHRCPVKACKGDVEAGWCCNEPLHELEMILKQQTSPKETAAIVIEPVQGEGGYVPPPPNFIAALKKICEKNDILLVADEVQTGFGRTGKWFAMDHWGVKPDILVMAKGIASGFPLSAIAARSELMEKQPPGSMGGTYAGNAVACAAAAATIEVFEEEKLLDNVNARGSQLMSGLKGIQKKFPGLISDVRGLGLMIGLEFNDAHPKVKKGFANTVTQACLNHKMLLLTTGIHETIRFIPPLIVNEEETNLALSIFEKSLGEAVSS